MRTETPAADTLTREVQALLAQLETLRDEIRLEVHLASLEARDAWRKLDPEFEAVAARARQASQASREAVAEALTRFQALRDEVRRQVRGG